MNKWEVVRNEKDNQIARYLLREDEDIYIEKVKNEFWLFNKGTVVRTSTNVNFLKDLGENIKWLEEKWDLKYY